MLTQRNMAVAAIALAVVTLAGCSKDEKTTTSVIATGTLSGTLTTTNGSPVVGATVTTVPDVGATAAPSAADGSYSIKLATGVYTITFAGSGVTRTEVKDVTVKVGETTRLDQVLPYSPIVLTLSSPPNPAGFGSPVTLTVAATGQTAPLGGASYTWTIARAAPAAWAKGKAYTQLVRVVNGGNVYECTTAGTSSTAGTGPSGTTTADDSIEDGTAKWKYLGALAAAPAITPSGSGAEASFDTETLASIAAGLSVRNLDIPNRPGLVGITVGDAEYMAYKVTVTVNDGKYTQNASTTVYPASYSHGIPNGSVGSMIVATHGDVASNIPFGSYAWKLTHAEAGDVTAELHGASTRNPWFIATRPGQYTLTTNEWQPGTAYAKDAYVIANGNVYKCATAGTSAATGSGPAGTTSPVVDGTAQWTFRYAARPVVAFADTFSGVASCATCHGAGGMAAAPKDQFAAWPDSGHGNHAGSGKTLFHLELAGEEYGGASCVRCHTTGYDLGASGNDGFSDRALAAGWTYPTTFSEANWDALPTSLKKLDGVQCESCHGPVGLLSGGDHRPSVSFSAMVCARCHDYNVGSHHDKASLWAISGHSNRSLAQRGAADARPADLTPNATTGYITSANAASCARCHTAQGFAAFVKQQLSGGVDDASHPCFPSSTGDYLANTACYLNAPLDPTLTTTAQRTAALNAYLTTSLGLTADNVEPQTCAACHDPHTTELRLVDDTRWLPSGFRVTDAGKGALCMLCHNSRNGARRDGMTTFSKSAYTINGSSVAIETIGTPHDQNAADVLSGNNLFFTPSYPGKHLQYVEDTCVGCHVNTKTGNTITEHGPNHAFVVTTEICAKCHSNATRLTDPLDGIEAQYDEYMGDLSTAIGNAYFAAVTRFQTSLQGNVQIKGSSGNQTAEFPLSYIASVSGPATTATGSGPNDTQVKITFNTPVLDPSKATGSGTTTTTYSASVTAVVWKGNDQDGVANAGRPIFHPAGLIARAIWNNALITRDMSKGVHNSTYVFDGLQATTAALDAYTASGTLPSGVPAP